VITGTRFSTMDPETADIETSSDDYATRFSGAVGAWMLEVQERIVAGWLADRPGATIVDVGGGHAQLAGPLARRGHAVTVVGSDPSCSRRLESEIAAGRVTFTRGNLIALPFGDRSFDVAISIRLVPHCRQWQTLAGELCRVARDAVIIDYPTVHSVNAFSGSMFGLKRTLEGNTRPYALFTHAEIRDAFAAHRFMPGRQRPQFFLPMVFHRTLKSRAVSSRLERLSALTGLTRRFGSPVLAEMVRASSSGTWSVHGRHA
jgi:2-polyprenyl-3-methyl-5-hydroxy-6-metoxy-1,4-benzoquinol methylase